MDKKDLSDAHLEEILYECAILRGVGNVSHRTIREFAWFVNECVFGTLREPYMDKFRNFINSSDKDTLKRWGLLFHEYCLKEYGSN